MGHGRFAELVKNNILPLLIISGFSLINILQRFTANPHQRLTASYNLFIYNTSVEYYQRLSANTSQRFTANAHQRLTAK